MDSKRVGIMGGTFDPIHNGHLIIAETSRENFNLDKIIFIPTGIPAHKIGKAITSNEHRYNMVLLATSSNPYFSLSPIELNREGTTYTIDTIIDLKKVNKDTEYFFIMGEDSLYNFHTWKDYKKLLKLCKFIVAKRPGLKAELEEKIKELNNIEKGSIQSLESPMMEISSTNIRERIKLGRSVKYLVPDLVEKYIIKYNLYGGTSGGSLDP